MANESASSIGGHRPAFRRVQEVRWPTYAVHCHLARIGFVSQLPEGIWLAYLPVGISSSGWGSREEAAEALHLMADSAVMARPAARARKAQQPPASDRSLALWRERGL